MPTKKTLPANGSLVTVRLIDTDAGERTFHSKLFGTERLVTESYGEAEQIVSHTQATEDNLGEVWVRVYSATGSPFEFGSLPVRTADWMLGYHDLRVRADSPNVTISPITKAGAQWVQANQSIENRRRILVEQVTALNPTIGNAVDLLFEAIDEDAFDRGKQHEWNSTHGW